MAKKIAINTNKHKGIINFSMMLNDNKKNEGAGLIVNGLHQKNTMRRALLLTHVLLLSVSLIAIAFADDDDDDDKPAPPSNTAQLSVDAKTQQLAGIVTQVSELSYYQSEYSVYGKALSSEPLLALHNRYLIAQSDSQGALATAAQLQQNAQRQQTLFNQGVSSKRALQEQQAQWQSQQALLTGKQLQIRAIEQEALAAWGKTLSGWALSSTNALEPFITAQKTLLQITLPTGKTINPKQGIMVANTANRADAGAAQLISIAPQNTNGSQGINYFVQTQHPHIRAGMSITAWLSETNNSQLGVLIPKSALVWSGDEPIVYIKTANQFERRVIHHSITTAEGYFISEDLKAGEQIVITGAQQLLSQQLRGQIPDEDD
jgi:hypothetical protein